MGQRGRPECVGPSGHTDIVLLDLVLPLECGGCGAPSTRWCDTCARALAVKPTEPELISPRLDPGVPVFSLGRYAGPRRSAILAVKERGRADLVPVLAQALNAALSNLLSWGIVADPLTLVPAPTRRSTARLRGGDPVTRIAAAARTRDGAVAPVLRTKAFTRDSVGLSAGQRQQNIAGRIVMKGDVGERMRGRADGEVVLVDDISTTGATATESVRVLQSAGARVAAVVVIAHA
jgi:predicted amidophosphoribosyltransferase